MVQPFIATQLIFVVGLASAREPRWPSVRDLLAALAVCAGLALLLYTESRASLNGPLHRDRILIGVAISLVLVAVVLVVGRRTAGWLSSVLLGMCAGLRQAMTAIVMKMALHVLSLKGLAGMLGDWPVYAVPVSVVAGVVLGQLAFTSGSLPPAVAAMTITNPVASLLFGLFSAHAALGIRCRAIGLRSAHRHRNHRTRPRGEHTAAVRRCAGRPRTNTAP